MRLISFSVDKYRSITRARKLALQDLTILIGPNNEGKSNLLRALVTVLNIVASLSKTSLHRGRIRLFEPLSGSEYVWKHDFPISLQPKYPEGESIFNLEFELTPDEIAEFKHEVKSNLDGFLPVQITIGNKEPGFKIMKRGPGGKTLSGKAQSIAQFIGRRFEFLYIPTVRTANIAENVVEEMVAKELRVVENDPSFKIALQEISKHHKPVLNALSANITATLRSFLPNIKKVDIKMSEEATYRALRRSFEVIVDDGTPTSLRHKGDGVQSLAALALMRHSLETRASGRSLVLAIEEPESHLHPNAIHQLREVLREISTKHQIIITTHCPLFVNRDDISSNILVTGNKAVPAQATRQIREILGVRASDNLRNAEIVLLVEGEEDRIALTALLSSLSSKLKQALIDNTLALDSMLGGSNLAYKVSQLRDALCICHCYLDNDTCGRQAFEKANLDGLVVDADVTFAMCQGMPESEIEDLYKVEVYATRILNAYGVSLDSPKFKTNKKWSQRMREAFNQQGKQWDERREAAIKKDVAELVVAGPSNALNEHKRSSIDALVTSLEAKLQKNPPKHPAAQV